VLGDAKRDQTIATIANLRAFRKNHVHRRWRLVVPHPLSRFRVKDRQDIA
jgi:hypothetical protein